MFRKRKSLDGIAYFLMIALPSFANAALLPFAEVSQQSSIFSQATRSDTLLYLQTFSLSQLYQGSVDSDSSANILIDPETFFSDNSFNLGPSLGVSFIHSFGTNNVHGFMDATSPQYGSLWHSNTISRYSASGAITAITPADDIRGALFTPIPVKMVFQIEIEFIDFLTLWGEIPLMTEGFGISNISLDGTITVTPNTISYSFPSQHGVIPGETIGSQQSISAFGMYVAVPEMSSLVFAALAACFFNGLSFLVRIGDVFQRVKRH